MKFMCVVFLEFEYFISHESGIQIDKSVRVAGSPVGFLAYFMLIKVICLL